MLFVAAAATFLFLSGGEREREGGRGGHAHPFLPLRAIKVRHAREAKARERSDGRLHRSIHATQTRSDYHIGRELKWNLEINRIDPGPGPGACVVIRICESNIT